MQTVSLSWVSVIASCDLCSQTCFLNQSVLRFFNLEVLVLLLKLGDFSKLSIRVMYEAGGSAGI